MLEELESEPLRAIRTGSELRTKAKRSVAASFRRFIASLAMRGNFEGSKRPWSTLKILG
jgi:hypothetical protein